MAMLEDRANVLLRSGSLSPKAKAYLLLKLSQVYVLLSPVKADFYWQQLKALQNHISDVDKKLYDELKLILEEEEDSSRGFAGEKIAEMKEKLSNSALSEWEVREFLESKAEEVRKRIWPGGKQAVWEELVKIWSRIDRKNAIVLTSKLSASKRQLAIRRMNREDVIRVDEWRRFSEVNSQHESVSLILSIIEDPNPKLEIPSDYIGPVVWGLIKQMSTLQDLNVTLDRISKFVHLVATNDSIPQIFNAIKTAARAFTDSNIIGNQWAEKFNAVFHMIMLGVSTSTLTKENTDQFVKNLPKHMSDFGFASCFGMLTNEEQAKSDYVDLLRKVEEKETAEAWFLTLLAERGISDIAYELATESPNKVSVLPRVVRAWLLNHPQAALQKIKRLDLQNDLVAEILCLTNQDDRVEFFREITKNGQLSLSGSLWATQPTEEEGKRFWDMLWSGTKTYDEVVQEYFDRNPLYASYNLNTPQKQQFTEFLRFRGYGEYSCRRLDPILLEGLIQWANKYPEEVRNELALMWQSIEPDDNIIKLDFLRNEIFNRCTTVFAVDPDFLSDKFITWIKRRLVDNSIVWMSGKTQYTVRYPNEVMSNMCLQGALATNSVAPERRDRLVELALTRFPSNDTHGELGAQLYNTGKQAFDIDIPWKTKSTVIDGWQLGIIKNAITPLFQEVLADVGA